MKNLFILFAVTGLLTTSSAFAQTSAPNCSPADWTRIAGALHSRATVGEQHRRAVQSLIMEEMTPLCQNISSRIVVGIPGNQYYSYFLSSGSRSFQVNIVIGGVEMPGTQLFIERK